MVVVELITYKLHPGADEDNFLKMQEPVLEYFYENQTGFIEPWEVFRREDGSYLDIVRWKSISDAKNAKEKSREDETFKMYSSFIETKSINIEYLRSKNILS